MADSKRLPADRTALVSLMTPLAVAVGGLAAFAYQHARAIAYGRHFGVHFVPADVRQTVVPFAVLGLFAAMALWVLVFAARTAAALVVPGAAAVIAVLMVVLPPYRPVVVALRLGFVVILWLLVLLVRRITTALDAVATTHRDSRLARTFLEMAERFDRVRAPMTPIAALAVATASVVGAGWLGTNDGRAQARAQAEFDVTSRDAGRQTVTVLFTREGDLVERVLDVSPDAAGRPRNVWLAGVTIRPMPAQGIRYETVRLGPTQLSLVASS